MVGTYQQSKQNSGKESSNKPLPGLLWGELQRKGRGELQTIHLHTPLEPFLPWEFLTQHKSVPPTNKFGHKLTLTSWSDMGHSIPVGLDALKGLFPPP